MIDTGITIWTVYTVRQAPTGFELVGTRWSSQVGPERSWVVKTLDAKAAADEAALRYQQTYDNTRRVAVGS